MSAPLASIDPTMFFKWFEQFFFSQISLFLCCNAAQSNHNGPSENAFNCSSKKINKCLSGHAIFLEKPQKDIFFMRTFCKQSVFFFNCLNPYFYCCCFILEKVIICCIVTNRVFPGIVLLIIIAVRTLGFVTSCVSSGLTWFQFILLERTTPTSRWSLKREATGEPSKRDSRRSWVLPRAFFMGVASFLETPGELCHTANLSPP